MYLWPLNWQLKETDGLKIYEWNWTKYFFGYHKTEGRLIAHVLLSLRHEKKKKKKNNITQKRQSGHAACSLLNSLNHLPLIQPDTANFGIRVWNENQYLFWAWKQSDCTLGGAWARHLFSVICKEGNRNFPIWSIEKAYPDEIWLSWNSLWTGFFRCS